jgi:hypothetical protein
LIGVIHKAGQTEAVQEFFELFKTPWEIYRPGQEYDVIIATVNEIPEVSAKLLLVYGAAATSVDACIGIAERGRRQGAILSHRDTLVPVYGGLLTFADGSEGTCCVTAGSEIAGLVVESRGSTIVRLGYDLFDEVQFLLSVGQPPEHAQMPALEIHVSMLRAWILDAGIPLVEIPPIPAGYSFIVCLTHDIDFLGVRNHRFDHTMWGFVYRGTMGAVRNLVRGRLSWTRLLRSWAAVASLPLVYAGWARDFWEPFDWYLRAEEGLPSTYFLIPFKGRAGINVPGRYPSRRAASYDVNGLRHAIGVLMENGCELGVHGIDAWHSADKGRDELAAIAGVTGQSEIGIRIHWLLRNANTASELDRAGYAYDSTFGYSETIGYRAGTSQVFRPFGVQTLLELPLHIQDGALFYPQRLDLSESAAEELCQTLIDNADAFGGVLTLLWHDRSHGPERFWGDFYVKLVQSLKSRDVWFGTAAQVVGWFRKRREVCFECVGAPDHSRVRLGYEGEEIAPPLRIRLYEPSRRAQVAESRSKRTAEFIDIPWNGKSTDELEARIAKRHTAMLRDVPLCSFS